MSMAQSHANSTATTIWDHYRGTEAHKSELRIRYYKYVLKYADAMKQLSKAKKFILAGEARSVKKCTLMAVDRVDYCDVELIKPPSTKLEANRKFLQANREFKDLCDIIVEICKSLLPNPIAALGSNSMNMAQSRANRTVALTWAHYRGITVHEPEVRIKYYKCFLKYTDVMNQLREANRYMLAGAPRFVKNYILVAVDRVNSCDGELMKPPREHSAILEANGKFKDLCSIILAICNKVPSLKSSKGKSLVPNSLAAIGSNSMNMALFQANITTDLIWRRYRGTTVDKLKMRIRYHKCFMKYAVDVMNQLTKANKYMLAGDARSVKNCISVAVKRVNSCSQELMKPPREQSGIILEANDMFTDLCSIILAICNTVPR
ncbi:hypothetical protein Pfo_024775 [Paulownia fortunei]|nr:hypothetical protein Pfo_024775 [Paulownia fortunei]